MSQKRATTTVVHIPEQHGMSAILVFCDIQKYLKLNLLQLEWKEMNK